MEDSRWVSEAEVARITGRAPQSLRNDRSLGRGLSYYKCGSKSVRYKLSEVLQTMEGFRVEVRPAGGVR